jgi:predicted RNA-binding protein Jag
MVEIKRPEMAIEIAVQNPHFIFLMGGDGKLLKSLKLVAPPNEIFAGVA